MAHGSLRRLLSTIRRQVDPDASGPAADERLLARFAQHRDGNAFELLVWRHGAMVYGVCRRVLRDHQLAEDAFQATFLALARKPRAVRSGAALPGWLHRVARRIAVRAKLDSSKRVARDMQAARSEQVDAADVLSIELQATIDQEIDRLPERLRRVVVLCYMEGCTADQASHMLGCPRGTVLSRLAAARERLRRRLQGRGLGVPAGGIAAVLSAGEVSAANVAAVTSIALGGAASVHVIGWAQGVLYAMFMNKIKLATTAVLATGLLGAGIGWVAVPGHGPAIVNEVQAAQDAPDHGARQHNEEALRMRQLAEQARLMQAEAEQRLKAALADIEALKSQAAGKKPAEAQPIDADYRRLQAMHDQAVANRAKREGDRAKISIQHRLALMEAEERLKALEREQASEQERSLQNLKGGRSGAENLKSHIYVLANEPNPDAARTNRLKEMRSRLEELQGQSKPLEDAYRADEKKRLEERLKAREAMIRAEEEAKLFEHQYAADLATVDAQLAKLRDNLRFTPRGAPTGDGRLGELERKLDALIREFADLRRELKK